MRDPCDGYANIYRRVLQDHIVLCTDLENNSQTKALLNSYKFNSLVMQGINYFHNLDRKQYLSGIDILDFLWRKDIPIRIHASRISFSIINKDTVSCIRPKNKCIEMS